MNNCKKVWVVQPIEYDMYGIDGVFSTFEKAVAAVKNSYGLGVTRWDELEFRGEEATLRGRYRDQWGGEVVAGWGVLPYEVDKV